MMYKTITLELMQQRSIPTTTAGLDRYSALLRDLHQNWMSDQPNLTGSEAMELAIRDLQEQMETDFGNDILSLEAAMKYVRRHTP